MWVGWCNWIHTIRFNGRKQIECCEIDVCTTTTIFLFKNKMSYPSAFSQSDNDYYTKKITQNDDWNKNKFHYFIMSIKMEFKSTVEQLHSHNQIRKITPHCLFRWTCFYNDYYFIRQNSLINKNMPIHMLCCSDAVCGHG